LNAPRHCFRLHHAKHRLRRRRVARSVGPYGAVPLDHAVLPFNAETFGESARFRVSISTQKYPLLAVETLALDKQHDLRRLVLKNDIDKSRGSEPMSPRVLLVEHPPAARVSTGRTAAAIATWSGYPELLTVSSGVLIFGSSPTLEWYQS
jgi:hypothetical protein